MTARWVLASANPDKVVEIREILEPLGIELVARPADAPDVDETEPTLEGNARLKAVALVELTGLPAISDDTGLEVDALDGAPGVRTARYAGPGASYADNVTKLLAELGRRPPAERGARFVTVALCRWPDGRELAVRGMVAGRIATEARGSRGFGYDPVFIPDGGGGRTFAEMTIAEKHDLSHRGRAFRALASELRSREL